MNARPDTLQRALDAYGGEAFWREARTVRAIVSTTGLAFVLKRQKPFRRVSVECDVRSPMTRIAPVNPDGTVGILRDGATFLEKPPGREIGRRENARAFFPYGRRLLWWDSLDQSYFAGYALWNYLAFPSLLLREDIQWRQAGPNRLMADFPADIPTHCPVQEFLFDPDTGLLRQHNYTAEIIGGWAKAANVVVGHGAWNGIPFPSRRIVTLRKKNGFPSAGPVLVDLAIHEWSVSPDAAF